MGFPERLRKKKKQFSGDELKKLLDLLEHEDKTLRLLTWHGLYTGARISELVGLRIDDIKADDGVTFTGIATAQPGKTDAATRWIPVPQQCRELLEEVKEEAIGKGSGFLYHDLVSLRQDGRVGYEATKRFSKLKRSHVTTETDKGFHSFRVMFATALQRGRVSELEAAYLLGHSRKGLTMSYGYYSKGYDAHQLAEAQAKAGAIIDSWRRTRGDSQERPTEPTKTFKVA